MSKKNVPTVEITVFSKNLLEQVSTLDKPNSLAITHFIDNNKEDIKRIVHYSIQAKGEWKEIKHNKGNILNKISSEVYQSGGNANFIAKIPNTDLVIKIAGDVNILYNLGKSFLNKNFYDPKTPPTQDDIKKIYECINAVDQPHYTFQSISRVVRAEAIKQARIPGVEIPETYLVYLQGNKDIVSDQTYLVVQKYMDTKGIIFFNDKHIQQFIAMPIKFFNHLLQAINVAQLWNLDNNIGIGNDGRIVILDTEARNIASTKEQWLQDSQDVNQANRNESQIVGLIELYDKISAMKDVSSDDKQAKDKLDAIVKDLENQPPYVKASPYYINRVKPFLNNIKR